MLFYFPMVFFTSLPEHYGCDPGDDPWRNTRTVKSTRLYGLLFWNGNFHAEHHLVPGIPSWNLPMLHARVGDKFAYVEGSYIRFHARLVRALLSGRPFLNADARRWTSRVQYAEDAGQDS
jgi:fatty acid desaturase